MNSFDDTPTNESVDAETSEVSSEAPKVETEAQHSALSSNVSEEDALASDLSLASDTPDPDSSAESPLTESDLPETSKSDSEAASPSTGELQSDAPAIEEEALSDLPASEPGISPEFEEAFAEKVEPDASSDVDAGSPVEDPEAVPAESAPTESEPVEADSPEAAAYIDNPLMNWFIIHTYSGFENKVSESLRSRSEAFGFDHRLGQILIPTEEVVEMRNGKKINSKRLLYPGYVLVQMEMDDDLWHQVKNTPRVTGFIGGGGGKPVPLSATEVNSILFRQSTAAERPRPKLSFDKNETVRIVDGPFANFSGKVDEINPERNTLRVMVTIFGRSTPVELDFLQVEKIA